VIFIEFSKKDEIVERHLDHLDIFTHVKTYHEFDDENPHLEGGIPILGPSLESHYEEHLDDVIERIENIRIDENSTPYQSFEKT
jgi:hypothetical protein